MDMKQNILAPFDGSANALEALKVAVDMAKAFNEKVVLLNIQPSRCDNPKLTRRRG
jgi:nucleotide-binding universal stress UspA family protein